MTEFIILSRVDMLTLCGDKPVTVYVDKKPYILCTDEYFEKQRKESQESEVQDADKCTYEETGCGSCKMQLNCQKQSQESEDKE